MRMILAKTPLKKHWAVNGTHPTQIHDSLEGARVAAARQATAQPGRPSVIYEAIETHLIPITAVSVTKL